jgi:hypothetical protein
MSLGPGPLQIAQDAMRSSRLSWLVAGSVSVVVLIVNSLTMAPTVTLVDSGELIVAARGLGVAHPPGFPLYCILAHVASYLPLGNIARRVNFASGLFAAVASGIVCLIVAEVMLSDRLRASNRLRPGPSTGKAKRRDKKSDSGAQAGPEPQVLVYLRQVVPCIFAGLAIAFSRTLWGYSTIAEVYTLNSLLIALIVLLMLRWRRARTEVPAAYVRSGSGQERGERSGIPAVSAFGDGYLYCAAVLFGLALGVHHVTVGLLLPGLAAFVFATEGLPFFGSKRLVLAALVSVAGLVAVYAYLPIAAGRAPVLNWGDPTTLGRIWLHISGWQYRVFLQFSANRIGDMILEFFRFYGREFGPAWLPIVTGLAVLGFVRLCRTRNFAMAALLGLVIAADLAYGLSYEIAEDKDAYYLPLLIVTAILAGLGTAVLLQFIQRKLAARTAPVVAATVLIGLLPGITFATNLPFNNRSHYYIARDYLNNILSTVGPGGTLFTLDWQVYSPLMYVREIERVRTDVVAIDVNLLRRSWYDSYLEREYPDLALNTRGPMDEFLAELKHWEADPDAYKNAAMTERINNKFVQMIMAFIDCQSRKAPVFITLDLAANLGGDNPELIKSITGAYQLVPDGLVFRLVTDRGFREPDNPVLETRGLFDGSLSFDADDVVRTKVIPVYLNMMVNRGRYLAGHGQYERAIEAYRAALDLEPDFSFARQSLAETSAAIEKSTVEKAAARKTPSEPGR